MGLSDADRQALIASLGTLKDDLRNLAERRKNESSIQLVQQQKRLFDIVRDRVTRSLSARGQVQLDAYIQFEVKRRIKIYGGQMPAHP